MSSAKVAVYVTPKASRNEVAGWRGSELVVRVTSAPEGGKANTAVCRVLASALGVPKSAAEVLRGHGARHKIVEIEGVDTARLREILGDPGESQR